MALADGLTKKKRLQLLKKRRNWIEKLFFYILFLFCSCYVVVTKQFSKVFCFKIAINILRPKPLRELSF